MKNVSLTKVTAVVVFAAFASNFVMANGDVKTLSAKAVPVKAASAKVVSIKTEQISFSQLINELDSDKNGLLSQAEVLASESKLLLTEFTKMDTDGDSQISEEEFNQYIAQTKDVVPAAKSTS
jgi:Ca2+-binding EF-hand superfamily protein